MSDYSLPRIKESELPEATSIDKVRVLDNAGNSVWVEKENFSLPASQISVSSESVEATTVDTAIDELSLDIQNFDESKENVSNKSQDINESPEDSQAYPSNPAVKTYVDTANELKADKATQIIAGAGTTGGGNLSESRTINVVSADDGIIVNADNIKLNIVNDLVTTSATRPVSATQGKKLQDEITQLAGDVKETTEKPTAQSLSELNARITALEAIISNKIKDRIDITKEFNVWGKTNLILIGSGAATFAPDFIGQKYIDTTGGNVYIAVGVSNAGNWKLV